VMDVSSGTARTRTDEGAASFDGLIKPLLGEAYGLACSMLHDRGAAEDAVQEAAIKAWRGIAHLRRHGSPRPWFFTIVANQCRDIRRRRRYTVLELGGVTEAIQIDHAERVILDLDLQRALKRLSPEQSALLFLRFRLDMPPSQIARVLRWRVGTVKSRLHRILRRLERELAPSSVEKTR
jgi:RNA polymerase sigma-70 factor (ECF subfamily)